MSGKSVPYLHDARNNALFNVKFRFGVAVFFHFITGYGDAPAKCLHKPKRLHRHRKVRVAVIGDAGSSKIFRGYIAVKPSWADYLNSVVEPINADWSVGSFVGPVENRIVNNLLNGWYGIQ